MIKRIYALLAVMSVLASAPAFAQMDPFDLHVASLRVLEDKAVQKELGVTPAQRLKMDNYANQYNADLKSYLKTQGKDPSQMASPDAQMLLMLTTLKKQVMGVLKPAQLKRLREVSLQAFGLNGLMDDAVGQKVGLSKDQLDRMRKTFEDGSTRANQMIAGALTPVNNQFKNAKPKTKDEKQKTTSAYLAKRDSALNGVMAQVQKVRADTQNAILAIVTPEQKATYVALQGKPFHAKPAAKPARKK